VQVCNPRHYVNSNRTRQKPATRAKRTKNLCGRAGILNVCVLLTRGKGWKSKRAKLGKMGGGPDKNKQLTVQLLLQYYAVSILRGRNKKLFRLKGR